VVNRFFVEMQAIVDELAQAIRRPITLEDAAGRLLAYSVHEQPVDVVRVETLLRRGASSGTLDALRNRGVYRSIDSNEGIARVPPIPELGFTSRACTAIRGRSRVLGYLWIVDTESSLSKSAEETVLRAGRRLSLELERRDSSLRAKDTQRSQLIAELCGREHPSDDALLRRSRAIGWYPAPPLLVIVIKGGFACDRQASGPGVGARSSPSTAAATAQSSIPAAIEEAFSQFSPLCFRGLYNDQIIAVLSGLECGAANDLALALAKQTADGGRSLLVGVGGQCESLLQVRRSYIEAVSAISLGSRIMKDRRHFDYGTLAPYELLSCMANCKEAGSYGRKAVEKVIAYDRLHNGSLFPTLEAYLDFYGKRKYAAQRLSIHPNTLDYRIQKALEVTGLDLDDPNTRLVTHIWVKALSAQAGGYPSKSERE